MDLGTIDLEKRSDAGAELELEHPVTGDVLMQEGDDEKSIVINLAGIDSVAYRNKQRELQSKRIAKAARSRSRKGDFSVSDEDSCELLAACTMGWDGIVVDGEVVKFSVKAAYTLYMERPWIREQVDAFIGDRANFFTM